MKKTVIIITILLVTVEVFASNYIKKYSSSTCWNSEDENGNTIINGNVIVEVEIMELRKEEYIKAHVFKTMLPFGQIIESDVNMFFDKDRYIFDFIDNWNNHDNGYFKFNDTEARLIIDCANFSEDGKNAVRLYDDKIIELHETTDDINYLKNSTGIQEVKEKLYKININYWPKDNSNLLINYIGSSGGYSIYSTIVIWGQSKRATKRLVIFNADKTYSGYYYGLPPEDAMVIGTEIIFSSMDKKNSYRFNLNGTIPNKIWVDGENFSLQK